MMSDRSKSPTGETLLANATLVLPDRVMRGALHLHGDRIIGITEGDAVPPGAVDLGGDHLAPGLVELHTDNLERHIQPRPKVDWPHDAAIIAHDAELAGVGITTVFDAMRVGSVPSGKRGDYAKYARGLASELLDLRGRGALRISHFLHLRAEVCSQTLLEELAEFGAEDRVGIVSLMDHTPGQRQFRDLSKLAQYVKGKHGLTDADFDEHVSTLMALRAENGAAHEAAAVAAAARFGAVLASHDDTTAGHVATSAEYGIRLAEFPTTIEAAQACHDHGIAVMMGAPNLIRGGSHSGNVAAAELAEMGLLDIVSSDYVPAALLSSAVRLGTIWNDLARGIATVTAAPAAAAGLADRGRLEVGARADLIRFRLLGETPVMRETWVSGQRVA
jgi:alpha-D-ribose 1-methylphosphonate 5-triphosphate diphosphatase